MNSEAALEGHSNAAEYRSEQRTSTDSKQSEKAAKPESNSTLIAYLRSFILDEGQSLDDQVKQNASAILDAADILVGWIKVCVQLGVGCQRS